MSRASLGALAAAALLCAAQVPAMPEGPTGLDVLPSLLELSARPGASVERSVTLTNPTANPLPVAARVSDWRMSEQGDITFAEAGTLPLSCAGWIRVEPASVLVPARGQATVKVAIASPADFSGTRWAAVLFSLAEGPGSLEGQPVLFQGRVGLTVYLAAEGTEREQIALVQSGAAADSNGKALLTAAFENRGNTAVRMRLNWQVRSGEGAIVATHASRAVSLPQARRVVAASLPEPLAPGTYKVTVMARWGTKRWQASECDLVVAKRGSATS